MYSELAEAWSSCVYRNDPSTTPFKFNCRFITLEFQAHLHKACNSTQGGRDSEQLESLDGRHQLSKHLRAVVGRLGLLVIDIGGLDRNSSGCGEGPTYLVEQVDKPTAKRYRTDHESQHLDLFFTQTIAGGRILR